MNAIKDPKSGETRTDKGLVLKSGDQNLKKDFSRDQKLLSKPAVSNGPRQKATETTKTIRQARENNSGIVP